MKLWLVLSVEFPLLEHGNELKISEGFLLEGIFACFGNSIHCLSVISYRNNHYASDFHLLQKYLGQFVCSASYNDFVKRSIAWQTQISVSEEALWMTFEK